MSKSLISKSLKKIITASVCFICALILVITISERQTIAQQKFPANSILYNRQFYKITSGLEEVYKPKDYHSHSELNLSNGQFFVTQVDSITSRVVYVRRPRGASFWLYTQMYSPGTSGFRAGMFSYAPADVDEGDPSLAQQFYFKKARVAFDINRNGDLDSSEYLDVVNGRISVAGANHNYRFSFDLYLENGQRTVGTFAGRFPPV